MSDFLLFARGLLNVAAEVLTQVRAHMAVLNGRCVSLRLCGT